MSVTLPTQNNSPEVSANWQRLPIAIKLALAIALMIVMVMSLLGFTILQHQKKVLSQQIENMGNTLARQLAGSASDLVMADDALGLQTLVTGSTDGSVLGAMVLSANGALLAGNGIQPSRQILQRHYRQLQPKQIYRFEWQYETRGNVLLSFISPIEFNDLVAGHVVLTFSRNTLEEFLSESRSMIIQITLLSILLAILMAFVMSRHLSRPIEHLVVAAREIEQGNFTYRLREQRSDELGDLAQAFNQMAEGLLRKTQVESAFSRYVSSNVARKIMEQPDQIELGGHTVQASVLFADVVGFTSLAETMSPRQVVELLNEYFSHIARVGSLYQGHVDKFIGDCAMIVFGATDTDSDHVFHAIACAVMIRKLVARLNDERIRRNLLPVHFRIGINSGSMVAGNLGSRQRMDFTVIGDTVNLASRLSSVAGSDQIVILDELYQQPDIKQRVVAQPHQTIQVRGKQKPVTTCLVTDVAGEHYTIMQQHLDDILQGIRA